MLQSHNLWHDRFLSIKLDCEGEREREGETDSFKKCLPPPPRPIATRSLVVDKTIQTEREREVAQETTSLSACTNLFAGQDPGSTATSRCSQSQAQDGHGGIVLTSRLPSASSKSTDITDEASFPSTDTVNTTKRNCPHGC